MNNLFQLSSHYQRLMDKINNIEEIDTDLMDDLENINDSLENKILNYASIIKELEAKADAIKKAILSMEKRVESLTKGAERLTEFVKNEMKNCDKKKIENEYHHLALVKNNPKVEYIDKSILPREYWRHKIKEIIEPDTTAISKALKEGISIPGAILIQDVRLTIR